jgi:nucleoid-associated protein YgaU
LGISFSPTAITDEWVRIDPVVSDTFRAGIVAFNKFYKNKHVVQKGETLNSISTAYFGDKSKADAIFALNKSVLQSSDPTKEIAVLTELEIPPK